VSTRRSPVAPAARPTSPTEDLVRDNLPLVGHLVNELIGRLPAHVSRDDLTSAGLFALVQAAGSYDAARGVPFARFASTRIRGALIDELRAHDWASRSVRSKARRRDQAVEELAAALGRTPTGAEVAGYLGVPESALDAVEGDVTRAVVLSMQGFGDPGTLDELVPAGDASPDERLLAAERIGYLHDAVAELPERLRTVVVGYFFAERPMADIAAELGVTESRVSQMRAEALRLLRDGMNAALDPQQVSVPERPGGCVARRREAYCAAVAAHSDYRRRLSAAPLDPASLHPASLTGAHPVARRPMARMA
jgi:RNA polymerase sigma factor for flagellar operon FliA